MPDFAFEFEALPWWRLRRRFNRWRSGRRAGRWVDITHHVHDLNVVSGRPYTLTLDNRDQRFTDDS